MNSGSGRGTEENRTPLGARVRETHEGRPGLVSGGRGRLSRVNAALGELSLRARHSIILASPTMFGDPRE